MDTENFMKQKKDKSLIHFQHMLYFYTPWKHQKPEVFWCFQGVEKRNIGWKWVNLKLLFLYLTQ